MRTRLIELAILISLTLLSYAGASLIWKHFHPVTTVTNPVENVKVVTVDRPVLTTQVVDKIITDPKQQAIINTQIKQINDLKAQVVSLTSTIAINQSSGGVGIDNGIITKTEVDASSQTTTSPSVGSSGIHEEYYSFKDYQLTANYNSTGRAFDYTLNQSFIISTTTGKRSDGSKLSLVELTQLTPSGPHKIPATTTEINVNESAPSWFISPRIQGGLGLPKTGVVALQWLKRGSSTAAEDTSIAVASPAVSIGTNGAKLTLLPISFNLGRIPKQPFTNLWVSPTINLDKSLGVAITATF